MRGKTKTSSHASRIAESLRGKKHSDQHRKAISIAMTDYWKRNKNKNKVPSCRRDKTCKFALSITKKKSYE